MSATQPSTRKSPIRLVRSRYSTPVPPIKRRVEQEASRGLSEETKAKLVMLAVLKTKCWSN